MNVGTGVISNSGTFNDIAVQTKMIQAMRV